MTTRRGFLAGLLAAATPVTGWAAAGSPDFLAAAQDPDGSQALYGFRADGSLSFRIPLPARGHAGAAHPADPVAVFFARRPGTFALVLDCRDGIVTAQLTPPEGRQFNGHGVFLDGGARLATSEQVAETSDGVIGFWDSATWRRIGEAPTGGIGPHELRLMPDGDRIIVANGGIATDPTDRTKLNIPDMRPNLSLLTGDGALVDQVTLDPALHQLSIRHLAVGGDGMVAFAMQWEGPPDQVTPLLGLWHGGAPVLAQAPAAEAALMNGYAGSVALAGDGQSVAITSPRGGRVQRFATDGTFLDAFARADICGAAPLGPALMTSDGGGALIAVEGGVPRLIARHQTAWDNHIVSRGTA